MTPYSTPRLRCPRRSWLGLILSLWLLMGLVPLPVIAEETGTPNGTIPDGSVRVYMPLLSRVAAPTVAPPEPTCPTTSARSYELIPVLWPPADHPHEEHGDLNLALRGYEPSIAAPQIIDINGPSDDDPPQFPSLFADGRTPSFTSAHQVYDWNWGCGAHGCRGVLLISPEVSLLGMDTVWEEPISFPSRRAEIYAGGFQVLVLYASEERITLGYTRDDSVAPGYAVHLEKICVDANLLALYRQANAAGRGELPALRGDDILGTAKGDEILAAVRDRGTFMDARSRKDWWRGR